MAFRIGVSLVSPSIAHWRRGFRTSGSNFKVVPFVLSDIGEGIKEVTVRDWFVRVGDRVKQFDDICEVESDKATVSITSRFDGVVSKLYYTPGDVALVGQPLVDIDTENEDSSEVSSAPTSSKENDESNRSFVPLKNESNDSDQFETQGSKSLATPAVRRIAKEHNVSLSQVDGTGKKGRILKEDILKFLGGQEESSSEGDLSPVPVIAVDQTVPIVGIKKAMAKAMTESHTVPSFGYSDELDVTKLVALRNEVKSQFEKEGVNLTYTPFFIKALSLALNKFPEINAHVDPKCENVIIKGEHNIGFAVDTPNGLLVPNLKGVQKMSLLEISSELNKLIQKAKNRSLTVEDMKGGTITISNVGIVGGTYVRPLINPPEVAIVGIGKFRKRPAFNSEEQIVAVNTCNVSWTADHRVIDGATLARFCELWRHYIENPLKLILVS